MAPAAPHRTPARPRLPRTAAGSHTAAPGAHTGHHRTGVPAHRNPGAAGRMPGARGLGPRAQEVGRTSLWGEDEGAVASGRRELSPPGREGAGQAHPGLVCSCLTGRGRPGPRHPRAPCAQPGGSEGTEGSGVTQHPSLFPGICSLGLPPSQPTPVFHASLAPPPVTAPTSESHPSFSLSSPHAAHKPTSQ